MKLWLNTEKDASARQESFHMPVVLTYEAYVLKTQSPHHATDQKK